MNNDQHYDTRKEQRFNNLRCEDGENRKEMKYRNKVTGSKLCAIKVNEDTTTRMLLVTVAPYGKG